MPNLTNKEILETISVLGRLGGARIIFTALSFISSAIIARNLLTEELGIYAIMTGCFAYLSIIGDFGLRSTAIAEASKLDNVGAVLWKQIYLRLIVGTFLYLIFILICYIYYSEYILETAILTSSILVISFQIDWVLIVKKAYTNAAWASISRMVIFLLLIIISAQSLKLELIHISIIFLLSWSGSTLFSWHLVKKRPHSIPIPKNSKEPTYKHLIIQGAPILGATLTSQFIQNGDLLWIGAMLGKNDAAQYHIANSIVSACLIFANAIGQVANSKYAKLRNSRKKLKQALKTDSIVIFVAGIFISIALYLISPLVPIIYSEKYEFSATLVLYFIPYIILYHIWSLFFFILIALGKERELLNAKLFSVISLPFLFWAATLYSSTIMFAICKAIALMFSATLMLKYILASKDSHSQ